VMGERSSGGKQVEAVVGSSATYLTDRIRA
jgi:hypothetical protein